MRVIKEPCILAEGGLSDDIISMMAESEHCDSEAEARGQLQTLLTEAFEAGQAHSVAPVQIIQQPQPEVVVRTQAAPTGGTVDVHELRDWAIIDEEAPENVLETFVFHQCAGLDNKTAFMAQLHAGLKWFAKTYTGTEIKFTKRPPPVNDNVQNM